MSTAQLPFRGGETESSLHQQIEYRGYALIEQNISSELIDEVIRAYATFTDEHPDPEAATMDAMIRNPKQLDDLDFAKDTQTEWHKYRTNTPHFAKPNGYTSRIYQAEALNTQRGLDIQEDPKEFYHYSPGMRERMQRRHEQFGWGKIPIEATLLNNQLHRLHHYASIAMTGFFKELEQTHPELAQFTTPADLEISPIRLLFYHKNQDKELAAPHYDRGLSTLQIAESHQGLRIRDPRCGEMVPVVRDPKYGVAFPAHKWKQANPGSTLQSLWHDVINVPTPCEDRLLHGKNVARWALIFFTNSINLGDKVNKKATHAE